MAVCSYIVGGKSAALHSGDGPAPQLDQFTPCTRWVPDWVRPKCGVDVAGKAKISTSIVYSPGIQATI